MLAFCSTLVRILLRNCRERFHARQWHVKFSPPMIEFGSKHLFVGDFVFFRHTSLGQTIGKIENFFAKVTYI